MVLSVLLAVGAVPAAPDRFLTGNDPRFPRAFYLVGTGAGRSLSEARAHAFAEVASQVRAQVEALLVARKREVVSEGGKERERHVAAHQEVREETRSWATFDTEGLVRVVDSHVREGTIYVLAVLSRREADARLTEEVHRCRAQLDQTQARLRTALAMGDDRRAARATRLMRELTVRLQAIQLRALALGVSRDPSGVLDAPRDTPGRAIDLRWRGRPVLVCFKTAVDFPEGAILEARVGDRLAEIGSAPLPCEARSTSPLALRLELRISGATFDELLMPGVVFCQTEASLSVLSLVDGRKLMAAELGGDLARGAGRDRRTAARKSLDRLGSLLEEKLEELTGGAAE